MNGHTPGPWKVGTSRNNRRQVSAAQGKQVALIWRHSHEESRANELLIAAAPELLAAAELALRYLDPRQFPTAITQINAAIAKATQP